MNKVTILLLFFFTSCGSSLEKEKTGETLSGMEIKIIIFDDCEYLYIKGGYEAGLSHKGNCKNDEHK